MKGGGKEEEEEEENVAPKESQNNTSPIAPYTHRSREKMFSKEKKTNEKFSFSCAKTELSRKRLCLPGQSQQQSV